jgi:uncharacterized protein YprB with RNaseH-like and TPR domain
VDEWLSGQEVETRHGRHFETERVWERHRRHGTVGVGDLADLPHDLLDVISEGAVRSAPPERWAFLDTETTGLAGGTGTYAFLIGVGRITQAGFHVRQFFMRDHGEEASLLSALSDHLAQFDVLVTYNGKTYDQPLLETRFRMCRARPPFGRMEHVDLLFGARRLWKLRFDSCRLVELENQILGVERQGDLPGDLIPYVYFEYLRRREAFRLVPIFHHNAMDILTLACLSAIVPGVFRAPSDTPLAHGAEMVGVARWLIRSGRHEEALGLMHRAIERGLRDELLFRTMWDAAGLEKKLGRHAAAIALCTELAGCRNAYRVHALEELAKFYEHQERNYSLAMEFTATALALEPRDSLLRRHARLTVRMSKAKTRLLQ